MKIIELLNAKNAFDMTAEIKNKQTGYKVVKFIRAIESEVEYYNKTVQELIQKYAEKDEDGNIVVTDKGTKIDKESRAAFEKEVNDLNSVEVDKPNIEFTIEELEDCSLTYNEMYALFPFIKQ